MSETFSHDNLLGGDYPIVTESVVVVSGAGSLPLGRVLGKVSVGTVPTTGTAGGSNTGSGTMGSVVGKKNTVVGTYTATCVLAAADGGTFEVVNPNGEVIGYAHVGVAFSSDEIGFTIADDTTDFAVDDVFTVEVPAGSGKFTSVDSTAIDGSAHPYGVLAEAADATSADVTTTAYVTGQFNDGALSFGGSDTIATHRAAMKAAHMFTRESLSA